LLLLCFLWLLALSVVVVETQTVEKGVYFFHFWFFDLCVFLDELLDGVHLVVDDNDDELLLLGLAAGHAHSVFHALLIIHAIILALSTGHNELV
jgi:hypothetical protein